MSQGSASNHGEVEFRVSLPNGIGVLVTASAEASAAAAALLGHISLFEAPTSGGSE